MFSTLRETLTFLNSREKATYWLLTALRGLSGLFDVVGITLIGVIAGSITTKAPINIGPITLGPFSNSSLFILLFISLLAFISKGIFAILTSKKLLKFLSNLATNWAVKGFDLVSKQNLQQFTSRSKSHSIWTLTDSATNAFTMLLLSFSTIVSESFLLLMILLTFGAIDPLMAIVVLIYFGLLVCVIHFVLGSKIQKIGHQTAASTSDTAKVVDDLFDSFREISVLSKQDFFVSKFAEKRKEISNSLWKLRVLYLAPRYVIESALVLGVALFVSFIFLTGTIESASVILGVYLAGSVRIMSSLIPLQGAFSTFKSETAQGLAARELSLEVLRNNSLSSQVVNKEKSHSGRPPEIHFENVSFHYDECERPAIQNINLRIKAGSSVAFVGSSGSGKSTIANLLLGLLQPSDGKITLDHESFNSEQNEKLRLAYVPQQPGLVSGTLLENIALGVPTDLIDREKVFRVCEQAALTEWISSLPKGIDTSTGEQNSNLSGGQLQRLGLARALYTGPNLLVLDEATSALDAISESLVTETITTLKGDCTIVVIAHRLSTVQNSEEVFLINEGQLIDSGKFSDLMKRNPKLAESVELMSIQQQ